MNRRSAMGLLLAGVLVAGCMPQPVFTPTPTKTPAFALLVEAGQTTTAPVITQTPTATVQDPMQTETTPPPTAMGVGTPSAATPSPTSTAPPPSPDGNLPPDHYVMERPIPTGWTDYVDRTYAYGATAGGKYRPHTGVEFFNPLSTPVVAVANSVVEYAGTDLEVLFGPEPNFYGNLIVLRLTDHQHSGQPVFALYGHLSEVLVTTGQSVSVREVIGAVGGTGVANGGPHLHFEVRVGDPYGYFTSTRNPDLWIKPYYGYGTLAGRVVEAGGALLREVALTIRGADMVRYTWTYAGAENISDPLWGENFTMGDLPEGWYTITTRSDRRTYSAEIYIEAGRTTWVEFVFD